MFTKFTISKYHFSQNSHFQNLVFPQNSQFQSIISHKTHIFRTDVSPQNSHSQEPKDRQPVKKSSSPVAKKKTEVKEDSLFNTKNIWKVREEYYKKAVKYWKLTVTDLSTIPKLNDKRLRGPLIYKVRT